MQMESSDEIIIIEQMKQLTKYKTLPNIEKPSKMILEGYEFTFRKMGCSRKDLLN